MDAPCIYACVPVVVRRWYLRVEMRLVKARTFTAPRNLLIELATRTVRAPAKKGYGFSCIARPKLLCHRLSRPKRHDFAWCLMSTKEVLAAGRGAPLW